MSVIARVDSRGRHSLVRGGGRGCVVQPRLLFDIQRLTRRRPPRRSKSLKTNILKKMQKNACVVVKR
jgi:hypothetical protein